MAATMLLLLAMLGIAFDFGRIYIARNEAQLLTDAAALTAVQKLDGTAEGAARAREAAGAFGITLEISPDSQSVRATAPENRVEILFLRAVGGPESFPIRAHSVAAANPVRLVLPEGLE